MRRSDSSRRISVFAPVSLRSRHKPGWIFVVPASTCCCFVSVVWRFGPAESEPLWLFCIWTGRQIDIPSSLSGFWLVPWKVITLLAIPKWNYKLKITFFEFNFIWCSNLKFVECIKYFSPHLTYLFCRPLHSATPNGGTTRTPLPTPLNTDPTS